jgi:hypothetical protein
MNSDRRTLIQSWILVVAYVLGASVWESSRHPQKWATEIFIAASLLTIVYFLFTARDIKQIQSRSENIKQILEAELWARIWVWGVAGLEVIVSLAFLLRGKDIGVLVPNVFAMWLAAVFPVSAPLIVSQVRLFRRLGKQKTNKWMHGRP